MSYISWKSCSIDKLFEKGNNDEVRRWLYCKFILCSDSTNNLLQVLKLSLLKFFQGTRPKHRTQIHEDILAKS